MKITLMGWNCRKNVGDDIMTDVILNVLKEKYVGAKITIIGEASDLPRFKSATNQVIIDGLHGFNFYNSIPLIKKIYNWIFIAFKVALFSDIIILGGGTIYHSVQLSRYYRFVFTLKKLFNNSCKIDSIGVSVGPFKTNEEENAFSKILSDLDHISLRDERSYDLVKRLNKVNIQFERFPDLALSYPIMYPINEISVDAVAIVLRQGHVTSQIEDFLLNLLPLINLRYTKTKITFYSFCEYYLESENDFLAITSFVTNLKVDLHNIEIIRYENDPFEFCRKISRSKLVITMRLHGAIMAYALNLPFFMISYHKKCDDFFDEMSINKKYLIDVNESPDLYIEKIVEELEAQNQKIDLSLMRKSLGHFNMLTKFDYGQKK